VGLIPGVRAGAVARDALEEGEEHVLEDAKLAMGAAASFVG